MSRDELGAWDAVETAARIRAGDVTASEVLEAAIERAQAARHLGALVTETFERARRAPSAPRGPLGGVPTAIKDLAQLRGVSTGWGSDASNSVVSRRSDPFVERFEATGVTCLGKSASPEMGLTATTEPVGQPPCRNPWDPGHSAGGSSGGAAALVASGVVPLAHASDGGGSIRIPASCCGLVGMKPSRYRMDANGSALLPVNIAVDGCVSRTVRDTVAFWEALESARAPKRVPRIGAVAAKPPSALRIAVFVTSAVGTEVHADNRDATLAAARLCERLGHDVEEIDCPVDGQVLDDFFRFWGYLAWLQAATAKVLMHRGFDTSRLEPWSHGIAGYFTSERWATAKAIRRLRTFRQTFIEIMQRFDVLVCPTTAAPPPKLGFLAPDLPFETQFSRLRQYVPFTAAYNTAGAPAISLPLGRSAEGLPLGVQFAASPGHDRMLLELARSLEEAEPWEQVAPPGSGAT